MSSFEREFNSAVEALERDVFINLVCENPQLTLAELTKLGKGRFAGLLGSVCVGDIIDGGRHAAAELEGADQEPGGRSSHPTNGTARDTNDKLVRVRRGPDELVRVRRGPDEFKSVNTRTPEGRKAYDLAVFTVVEQSSRPIKAPEITARVGGTALQVRKALARLIDTGKVSWEGKARGMRYRVIR